VILEGYLDVIQLHHAGYTKYCVTDGHRSDGNPVRLLKRFTPHYLSPGCDAAGKSYPARIGGCPQSLDHADELTLKPRLLRHEARLRRMFVSPPSRMQDPMRLCGVTGRMGAILPTQAIVIHVMETWQPNRM
jgi:hypothetical protein